MRLKITTIAFLICIYTSAFAQLTVSILDETNPGLVLSEFKAPANHTTEAAYYVDENWNQGNLVLHSNKRLSRYPLKFNIQTNQLEIKTDRDIKVCGVDQLNTFEWFDSKTQQQVQFINGRNLKDEKGQSMRTFLEVLVQGPAKAYVRYELKLKKANYVATVDLGSKEDKIVKDENYYIAIGQVLHEVTPKKEKNIALFNGKEQEIKAFVNTNNLKFNKRADLIKIVDYYNSL